MWRLSFLVIPLQCAVMHGRTGPDEDLCATLHCSVDTQCLQYNGEAECYNTTCPTDEVFLLCSTKCEPSCNSIKPECQTVDHMCGPPACECRPGFVRNNGKCIRPQVCPGTRPTSGLTSIDSQQPTCAAIEIDCLPGFHCEDTLTGIRCAPNKEHKPLIPRQRLCDLICLPGTHCDVSKGKPECVMNEVSRSVAKYPCAGVECPRGQYCELFDNTPKCIPLPGPCAAVFCAGGQCVEYNNTFGCFDTSCAPHEEFKICATCERTCEPLTKKCDGECLSPACQCVEGYVRHNGECIRSEKCETSQHGETSKRWI